MKRIICMMLIIIILLFAGGCSYNKQADVNRADNDGRMALVYNDGFVLIYKDTETGVEYITRGGQSGICVMVNDDGTPYTGEQ